MTPGKWRKSTRSGAASGNCVETRTFNVVAAPVEVRDSKAPELGSLAINRSEFAALLASVKLQRLVAAVHLAEVGRCSYCSGGDVGTSGCVGAQYDRLR